MKVFPVVHINEIGVATEQASRALDYGADGVYLINHKGSIGEVFNTFNILDKAKPGSFIGVNLLGVRPRDALRIMNDLYADKLISRVPDGLWTDDALDERTAGETLAYKNQTPSIKGVRYLGGIAFKYTQSYSENPNAVQQLTAEAQDRVDVVTTSGAGTGKPPTVAKIVAMHQVANGANKLLAVASGIDSTNIAKFQGIVDEVLVASSIETAPYSGIFDADKLKEIISLAHSL